MWIVVSSRGHFQVVLTLLDLLVLQSALQTGSKEKLTLPDTCLCQQLSLPHGCPGEIEFLPFQKLIEAQNNHSRRTATVQAAAHPFIPSSRRVVPIKFQALAYTPHGKTL
jgi:hypothetical protein